MPINRFRGEFFFLSNFYPCSSYVEYESDLYPTSEHAYQAAKIEDRELREPFTVFGSVGPNPMQAKSKGGKVKLRGGWANIRVKVMEAIVLSKFTRDEALMAKLVKTGNQTIVEGHTGDTFWGGKVNHLGRILMKVREAAKCGEIKAVSAEVADGPELLGRGNGEEGENRNGPGGQSPSAQSGGFAGKVKVVIQSDAYGIEYYYFLSTSRKFTITNLGDVVALWKKEQACYCHCSGDVDRLAELEFRLSTTAGKGSNEDKNSESDWQSIKLSDWVEKQRTPQSEAQEFEIKIEVVEFGSTVADSDGEDPEAVAEKESYAQSPSQSDADQEQDAPESKDLVNRVDSDNAEPARNAAEEFDYTPNLPKSLSMLLLELVKNSDPDAWQPVLMAVDAVLGDDINAESVSAAIEMLQGESYPETAVALECWFQGQFAEKS
eukprot:TRINITY_DN9084_c1_g1_i1.p1 TRINITY_DN9084_c1_g1~~TRINITY_DN9084_c1_g1_i1.p1  ORF type:complete len:435 (-),score=75.88 TRINITY_DN9084_c1_g1_i1:508-1812(-)